MTPSEGVYTNSILVPSLDSAEDSNTQQYSAVLAPPTPWDDLTGVPFSFPAALEGYDGQNAWLTPSSPKHHTSVVEHLVSLGKVNRSLPNIARSPLSRVWHQKRHQRNRHRSSKNPIQSSFQAPPQSTTPKVNSKAVDMITGVERLYNFGVSVGNLQKDRDTQNSLRSMKISFMSLLPSPPATTDDQDSSTDMSFEDNSE
ncbi:hypothetical protein EJ08DRAFT_520499 [Tothia fuscella]|uniref:Uncharacterized protein n=1 Tax=Tothia fuscella TaxID=1048955 RepID=A0A9P4NHE9_9PEZI|nr:hypothetical protein EJ08DRAFT_520499 [Tothia fuscella]